MDFAMKVALATHLLLVIRNDVYVSAECNEFVHGKVPSFMQCRYRCHCKDDGPCEVNTGYCSNGCDYGWMGPGCQYRNIAIYSTVSKKKRNPVDGDKSTCYETERRSDRKPKWFTHFDRMYEVIGLKITVQSEDTEKFRNFRVETGDNVTDKNAHPTLCYQHPNTTIETTMEIMCNQPIQMQQLRIKLDTLGEQLTLCEVEIYGGRSIIFNKPSKQISTYHSPDANFFWNSNRALDGRIQMDGDDDNADKTCSATKYEKRVWWMVNLEAQYTLYEVQFFGRLGTKRLEQYRGFRVLYGQTSTSLTQLYQDAPTAQNDSIYQPMRISMIKAVNTTLLKVERTADTEKDVLLVICELVAFAECPSNKCGWDCSMKCFCSSEITGSYKISGTCPNGCKGRWTGADGKCDNECDISEWGARCDKKCGHCQGGATCNVTTGECEEGCGGPWEPPLCTDECSNSTYGMNCSLPCGHCNNDTPCSITDGTCTNGCEPGWELPTCKEQCQNRTYGYNCRSDCGMCANKAVCDSLTGECPDGCELGYQTQHCNETCPDRYYGENCAEECGHCENQSPCDKVTGNCSSCHAGYRGQKCKQQCLSGTYGPQCSQVCGQCIGAETCDFQTGFCQKGCDPGYQNTYCNEKCLSGTYGPQCSKECGQCIGAETCDFQTGFCQKGCDPGYQNTYCNEKCLSGTYGPQCSKECGQCIEAETCDFQTGFCQKGCDPGYQNTYCNEKCDDGTYGDNCTQRCGHCTGTETCDSVTGECPHSCKSGYTGPLCATKEDPDSPGTITTVLIAVLVLVVVLAIIVVAVIIHKRRQPNPNSEERTPALPITTVVPKTEQNPPSRFNNKPDRKIHKQAVVDIPDENVYGNTVTDQHDIIVARLRVVANTAKTSPEPLYADFKDLPYGVIHDASFAKRLKKKNKYSDMFPYNFNRVMLPKIEQFPDSTYINASYIDGFCEQKKYIAAQGAIMSTIVDIWRMVWSHNITTIVMLTNCYEAGKSKCDKYWPEEHLSKSYGSITVEWVSSDECTDYCIRTFKVSTSQGDEQRTVEQFHYTAWPDKDVPDTAISLVQFWRAVKKSQASQTIPWMVHCSAGVGRTGTFIGLDFLYEQGQAGGVVNVKGGVNALRQQRVKMVQTKEQYVLLHEALADALDPIGCVYKCEEFSSQISTLVSNAGTPTQTLHDEYQAVCDSDKPADPEGEENVYQNTTDETAAAAKQPINLRKSRDPNIYPDDLHRPLLSRIPIQGHNEFINAVFVSTFRQRDKLILTQVPLTNTVEDFVRMIWDTNVSTFVLMEYEIDEECCYWPLTSTSVSIGPIQCELIDEKTYDHYIVRTLKYITDVDYITEKEKIVRQFHFQSWFPGRSTPESTHSILALLSAIEENVCDNNESQIVFQCLDGANRSGLMCVLWCVLERMKSEREIGIAETVRVCRTRRRQVIGDLDQYAYCYKLLNDYLKSVELYSNFL